MDDGAPRPDEAPGSATPGRPLRIGVTGHRAYDDVAAVEALVERAVGDLAGRAGGPLEVWSSLAEGADRVVAATVLERRGARLVAVLPLPAGDYRADFRDERSRDEFDALVARADRVIVAGPAGPVDPAAPGVREAAYERAGLAIVAAVDVLVAVWDGATARGRGGTAEIVDAARDRGVELVVVPVTRRAVAP